MGYETTNNGYVPPSAATGYGSSSGSDWIDLVKLAMAWKDSNKTPKFKAVPQTPEEQELLRMYINGLKNPAMAGNAAEVSGMGRQVLNGYSNLSWQSPKTFSGEQGYSGSSTPFTAPKPTAPTKTPGNGGGAGRPANRYPQMDVAYDWANGHQQDVQGYDSPRWGESIYDYLSRNPGGSPGNYLPNGGQTADIPDGMEYGQMPDLPFDNVWGTIDGLLRNGNAQKAASLFNIPLAILMKGYDAARDWWERNHPAQPAGGGTGSGFVDGSIAGSGGNR